MGTVQKLFLIGLAGGLGALARYGLSGLAQRLAGTAFPLGTFAVNMAGCLLFGLVWGLLEDRVGVGSARLVILTGFMGAFTTFSTFMFETQTLMQQEEFLLAVINVAGQCLLGLVLILSGLFLGRTLY